MFDHCRLRGLACCAEELLGVIDGENCTGPLPQGVRKRLRKDGTLKMFGSRYEVTPLGRKMLETTEPRRGE